MNQKKSKEATYWEYIASNGILNKYKDTNLFSVSFQEVDDLLKEKSEEIKCQEVAALYAKYWCDIKEVKSNAIGCPIFSELIVTRLTLHHLNNKYNLNIQERAQPCHQSTELLRFISLNGKYGLATECIPEEFNESVPTLNKKAPINPEKRVGREKPDNVIFRITPPKIYGFIATKSYTDNLDNDLKFRKKLRELELKHSDALEGTKHLIVIMGEISQKRWNSLTKEGEQKGVYSLWNNNSSFSEMLDKELDLKRIKLEKQSN